ncbi:hypothetical protein ACN47E_008369 [Coniothyrium glycines]
MHTPSYQYHDLDPRQPTIRILEVLTPSTSEEILCRLTDEPLVDGLEFTALSYCWGAKCGTIPTSFVQVNGQRASLKVTPSVQSFLFQFIADHPEQRARPKLWIDAVCINQSDLDEKNVQVAMMQHIYQMADNIIIWLGHGDQKTDAVMDFVSELLLAEKRVKEFEGQGSTTDPDRRYEPTKLGLPSRTADDYANFALFLNNEWFSRVWVIQEAAMASRNAQITCGTRSISWDDFAQAFFFFSRLDVILPDPARRNRAMFRILGIVDARDTRKRRFKSDLLGVLVRCRSSSASEAKDKVFALLGLATDVRPGSLSIQVDYKMDVQQVYCNLAFEILRYEERLDFLGVPRGPETSEVKDLPSWVIDWSIWDSTTLLNRRDRPASNEAKSDVLIRNATGPTRADPKLSDDGRNLCLQGYLIDEITETGMVYESEDSLMDYDIWILDGPKLAKQNTQALIEWEYISKARKKGSYAPTGQPLLEAYWQTITAGWQLDEHKDRPSSSTFLQWDKYYRPGSRLRKVIGSSVARSSAYAWFTLGLNISKQITQAPPEFGFDGLLTMSSGRRFVRTSKGHMGIAPRKTQIGDSVALFRGGGSPLVIRPAGQNWELIGESYMHGMMDAECWNEHLCSEMWLV